MRYSIHGPTCFFHSHFSIELVLYEMYFFSLLTIATPPFRFESHPVSPSPLHDEHNVTWPPNNTAQSIFSAASRKSSPLLPHSEPSITSKQVQNMVLHLHHCLCFLTTEIPAECLLFPISLATVYFFSRSHSYSIDQEFQCCYKATKACQWTLS
jgi:hypothetical protein